MKHLGLWFLLAPFLSFGSSLDSLKNELAKTTEDTIKLELLEQVAFDPAFEYAPGEQEKLFKQYLQLSQSLKDTLAIISAYYYQAKYNYHFGLYEPAIENYYSAIEVLEKTDREKDKMVMFNDLAMIYAQLDNGDQSMQWYLKCIDIIKSEGSNCELADLYWNISQTIKRTNVKTSLSIDSIYHLSGINYKVCGGDYGLGNYYFIDGQLHENNPDSAIYYYRNAVLYYSKINAGSLICQASNKLALMHLKSENLDSAEFYAKKAHNMATDMNRVTLVRLSAMTMYEVYKKTEKWPQALEHYEQFITIRDSINNEKNQKTAIRQQTKYEFEKAQLIKEQEEKEQARIDEELTSRRNNLQYSGIFVFVLLLFAVVFMSGKFAMSERLAEGLIFFTFLLFFEFCLVLMDPIIETWTNGEPMFKLLLNALLAALIFPLHAFFERTLKNRLLS